MLEGKLLILLKGGIEMTEVVAETGRRAEELGRGQARVQIYCEHPDIRVKQWEDEWHIISVTHSPDGIDYSSEVDEVWALAQVVHAAVCKGESHHLISSILFGG